MCKAHNALQELQEVTVMQCRLAFQLSGKMVALYFDNSTAKFIYVIEIVQYLLIFQTYDKQYKRSTNCST